MAIGADLEARRVSGVVSRCVIAPSIAGTASLTFAELSALLSSASAFYLGITAYTYKGVRGATLDLWLPPERVFSSDASSLLMMASVPRTW